MVFALGFFDGVHLGHQALLKAAGENAAALGCPSGAITFLDHPDGLVLGSAPALLCTPGEREALLREYGAARVLALPFDRALMQTPWQDFYEMLKCRYGAKGLVCGEDFRFGKGGEGTAALLAQACAHDGLSCTVVPRVCIGGLPVSSSRIRALLGEGRIREANTLLGRSYAFTGTVVHGKHLGRTLGFPTANVSPCPTLLRKGVYAAAICFDGRRRLCLLNVGTCPTVDGSRMTAEAHIPGFSGDLYGKTVKAELLDFLRPEQKFPSKEALCRAISENIRQLEEFI